MKTQLTKKDERHITKVCKDYCFEHMCQANMSRKKFNQLWKEGEFDFGFRDKEDDNPIHYSPSELIYELYRQIEMKDFKKIPYTCIFPNLNNIKIKPEPIKNAFDRMKL